MKIKFHVGYFVITIGYMIGIFLLSEIPDRGGGELLDRVPDLLSNLLHVPLFAGLAWCLLLSVAGGRWNQRVSLPLYGIVGLLAGSYAVLDECHQSLVAGRFASVGDLLLDSVGIGGLLFLHHLSTVDRRPSTVKPW